MIDCSRLERRRCQARQAVVGGLAQEREECRVPRTAHGGALGPGPPAMSSHPRVSQAQLQQQQQHPARFGTGAAAAAAVPPQQQAGGKSYHHHVASESHGAPAAAALGGTSAHHAAASNGSLEPGAAGGGPQASPPFSASPAVHAGGAVAASAAEWSPAHQFRTAQHDSHRYLGNPFPMSKLDDVQLTPPHTPNRSARSEAAMGWAPKEIIFPEGMPTILRKRPRGQPSKQGGAGKDWKEFLHGRVDKRRRELIESQGADELYYVERIIASRRAGTELLVKWVGYSQEESTWELRSTLSSPGELTLVAEYDAMHPQAAAAAVIAETSDRLPWSDKESQLLSRLVEQEGEGSWQQKSSHFPTKRTARALQHQWHRIGAQFQQHSAAESAGGAGGHSLTASSSSSSSHGASTEPSPGGGEAIFGASPRTMEMASMLIQRPHQQQHHQQPAAASTADVGAIAGDDGQQQGDDGSTDAASPNTSLAADLLSRSLLHQESDDSFGGQAAGQAAGAAGAAAASSFSSAMSSAGRPRRSESLERSTDSHPYAAQQREQEQAAEDAPALSLSQSSTSTEEMDEDAVDARATIAGTLDLAMPCPLCRRDIMHAAADLDGTLACFPCMETHVTHNGKRSEQAQGTTHTHKHKHTDPPTHAHRYRCRRWV